jgi:HK97 family phage portal protein
VGIFDLFRRGGALVESKASAVQTLIVATMAGRPVWPGRDYEKLAREGYQQNPIVGACVRAIAFASASIPLELYEKSKGGKMTQVETDAILDLLDMPSPGVDEWEFRVGWISYLLISGNVFIERVDGLGGEPIELYLWRPDRAKVVPGADGWPMAYEYTVGGMTRRIPVKFPDGKRPVLHVKEFHPVNDFYGMPRLDNAAYAVDVYTGALAWNKSLLENAARPPGALVVPQDKEHGGGLNVEQIAAIRQQLQERFSGTQNAGKPLLLTGGMTWERFALTPVEMDYIEGKADAARDIARSFGVPPMLLGIPGDNTYSNYQEANRAFYRDTVLPLTKRFAKTMTAWLIRPAKGPAFFLHLDEDEIPALITEREAKWKMILSAGSILDVNEQRRGIGYEDKDGCDVIMRGSSEVPFEVAVNPPADGGEADPMDPSAAPDAEDEDAEDHATA